MYVDSNQIQRIPEELTQLKFIKQINISRNNLQELPCLPFISEAKLDFEENPCINEIPFLFGCQQNHLTLLKTRVSQDLNRSFWYFPVKGCGIETSKYSSKVNFDILNKKPPSLLEIMLRFVYCLCYKAQISYKKEEKYFKRTSREVKKYGELILNQLPTSLKTTLLKGRDGSSRNYGIYLNVILVYFIF